MVKLRKDYQKVFKSWKTPNTYNNNYMMPPLESGVYIIVRPILESDNELRELVMIYEILYIGASKNLSQRYNSHEMLRILRDIYGCVQFYFKIRKKNYMEYEKILIKQYNPKFNKQYNY